jgi:hypothetical protein
MTPPFDFSITIELYTEIFCVAVAAKKFSKVIDSAGNADSGAKYGPSEPLNII